MHIEEMDMEVEWNEEMERIWFYQTKVGEIGIGEKFGAIVRVTFGRDMGGRGGRTPHRLCRRR